MDSHGKKSDRKHPSRSRRDDGDLSEELAWDLEDQRRPTSSSQQDPSQGETKAKEPDKRHTTRKQATVDQVAKGDPRLLKAPPASASAARISEALGVSSEARRPKATEVEAFSQNKRRLASRSSRTHNPDESILESKQRLASRGTIGGTTEGVTRSRKSARYNQSNEETFMQSKIRLAEGRHLHEGNHSLYDEKNTSQSSQNLPMSDEIQGTSSGVHRVERDSVTRPGAYGIRGPGIDFGDNDAMTSSDDDVPTPAESHEVDEDQPILILPSKTVEAKPLRAHVARQFPLADVTEIPSPSSRYIVFGVCCAVFVVTGIVMAATLPDRGSSPPGPTEAPVPNSMRPTNPTFSPTSAAPTFGPTTLPGEAFTSRMELLSAVDSYLNETNGGPYSTAAAIYGYPIGVWNVSHIKDFRGIFAGKTVFNEFIGHWDVSSATDLSSMFEGAFDFDQDISAWDVSSVTSLERTFRNALSFNSPLNNWSVDRVTSMSGLFEAAQSFNQEVSLWKTFAVTNLNNAFFEAKAFDQPLNSWSVDRVNDMTRLFMGSSFNRPLDTWNTASVEFMNQMFDGTPFNADISMWSVSTVYGFFGMFQNCLNFNQDLGTWRLSNARNLNQMFVNSALNQSLCAWQDYIPVTATVEGMFEDSACIDTSTPSLGGTASSFCHPC